MSSLPNTNGVSPLNQRRDRVLVVDDEQAALDVVANILDHAGYEVTTARNASSACELLSDQRYDLVVTDLYMDTGAPEGGSTQGFDSTGRFGRQGHPGGLTVADMASTLEPVVPVVLLTGRPSFDAARNAMRTRVREIIPKPVDSEQLMETCERTIRTVRFERRARSYEEQNRVLVTLVPRMIEAKDPSTSGHAERVVKYVDRLGERVGLDAETRESLRMAGLLHDVGKVGVPDEILQKDGPLTVDEREVIQHHPKVGFDMLADLDCDDARRWVYQHHERWDGKGYPEGLGGEEVELPGRILILAEVFDALAEKRTYKEPWPMERIIAFFREQAGKHFDPHLALEVASGLEREGNRYFAPPDLLF